ncbi:DNA-binding NarL/FixJ family response regulator [Lipingzhangella halophila]|uniref:DNA-binding NarL/FixJ family response regulator n=1 Tax=Lipingzhangella halophila TaxID=1783352 RepID=A0A7W7RF60_9ACTN|nr:response regulator transcription factor [Lipingzhangella halophila]MBB4930874.1 DNA-binding NarL/FixJ family response regulator [Lipingzhangella halophila]
MKVRCTIAGDQVLACLGLRTALDSASDIQVVAEARNRNTALRNACDLRPNVMVVHSFADDSNTLELLRDVASLRGPGVRVLLIAAPADGRILLDSLRAGARGFLLPESEPATLIAAVRDLARGNTIIAPSVAGTLVDEFVRIASLSPARPVCDGTSSWDAGLSEREGEVVALVSSGYSNSEIARILRLAPTTVKTHMSNALAKRDARDRVQLVVQVYRAGFAGFKVASVNGPARTGGPAAAAPDDRAGGTEVR